MSKDEAGRSAVSGPVLRTAPEPRSSYVRFIEITTRWSDNDFYGHVNNVTYYSWIDTAVNKVLIDSGVLNIRYSRVIGLVVQSQCQYFKPISYPELVQVGVRVGHIGKTSIRYELGIFTDESDTAAAQGHFIHVYVNRGTQQPVSLPIELRHVAESLRTQA